MCRTIGAVFCLPCAPTLLRQLKGAPALAIAWMVYLAAFPTAVGFTTWAYALARGTAGRLAATTYLVPPIVVVTGWVTLSEVPRAVALLGGALCLVGVYVARRMPPIRPAPSG
jgi:drug/metabolite transporter (DMT)-like permease